MTAVWHSLENASIMNTHSVHVSKGIATWHSFAGLKLPASTGKGISTEDSWQGIYTYIYTLQVLTAQDRVKAAFDDCRYYVHTVRTVDAVQEVMTGSACHDRGILEHAAVRRHKVITFVQRRKKLSAHRWLQQQG